MVWGPTPKHRTPPPPLADTTTLTAIGQAIFNEIRRFGAYVSLNENLFNVSLSLWAGSMHFKSLYLDIVTTHDI